MEAESENVQSPDPGQWWPGHTVSPRGPGSLLGSWLPRPAQPQASGCVLLCTDPLCPAPPAPARRLDANLISLVPERSFEGLSCLRHLWLDDNALTEVPVRALNNLPALQAMTLALNRISRVPDYAFQNLTSLVVL